MPALSTFTDSESVEHGFVHRLSLNLSGLRSVPGHTATPVPGPGARSLTDYRGRSGSLWAWLRGSSTVRLSLHKYQLYSDSDNDRQVAHKTPYHTSHSPLLKAIWLLSEDAAD